MRADAQNEGSRLPRLTNDPVARGCGAFAGQDATPEPYPATTFLTSFTSANLMSGARSAV
jgi:hypothetical protein